MKLHVFCKTILCILLFLGLTSCNSTGSGRIDELFGEANNFPLLNSISPQLVSQTDQLKIDINNIKKGEPGNDEGMTYTCYFDDKLDGEVLPTKNCSQLPAGNAQFSASTGILLWTPDTTVLGNYEVKINGQNKDGVATVIFTVGVRLKFSGLESFDNISGTGVTLKWTPNTQAVAYQVFKYNHITTQYELFQTVNNVNDSQVVLTGLTPSTGYTFRIKAMDQLGNLDPNVISKSVTTTELVKLSLSPALGTVPAGTSQPITVQAYNADNTPQTVGGLVITPSIESGTSTGVFSAVIDNGNGTYSFSFTPEIVGTSVDIILAANVSFYLNNKTHLNIIPGPVNQTNSSLVIASSTVTSGQSTKITATLKDAFNNPIDSGLTVSFSKTGGTSTGTFDSVVNVGSGVYTINYSGVIAGSAQTIQVLINGVALTNTVSVSVVPGVPVSSQSTLVTSTSLLPSGTDATITATLRDLNNNLVPTGVSVTFNKSGGTSTGNFGSVINLGNGSYTTTYTGLAAGTAQTISVLANGVLLTPTVTIAVVAGVPHLANSTFTLSQSTVVSGNFITASATIKDINNNPIDSGITVTFAKTGGTSTGNFNTVSNQGNGVYSIRYTGVLAGTAQNISVLINAVTFGSALPIVVTNGSPSATQSTIAIDHSSIASGSVAQTTVILKDENGNRISSGYAVSFSKTGGTSTGTFDTVVNAGNGVYTINYTGVKAGLAQNIGLLIDGSPLGLTVTVTVTPGAPSNAMSTLVLSSNTVTAGDTVTLTATIKDSDSNPISSGILVMFDKIGGTSTGTLSVVTNQGNGVYTAIYTGVKAGTAQTIQANVNGAGFGPTQNLQVLVGVPTVANSTFTLSANTVTSGSSILLTADLKDSQNNAITNQYTITFDAVGGTSSGNLSGVTNVGNGKFTSQYTGIVAGTTQTLRVLYDGVPLTGLNQSVTVQAGSVSLAHSSFSIQSASVQSGTNSPIEIILRDNQSNPINLDLVSNPTAITFILGAGTSSGTIANATNNGNGNYTSTFTATTMGTARTIGLNVNGTSTGLTISVTVTAGPPTHLSDTGPMNPVPSIDCNGPYTLTLKDSNENTTVSTAPVTFSISDTPVGGATGTLFSDVGCNTNVSEIHFPAYINSQQFYYKSYQPQNLSLILAPTTGVIANKTLTIQNLAVLSWIGAAAQFTMIGSGSNLVGDDTSGGFITPTDNALSPDGRYMYVVDSTANRINKYDLSNNTFVGWIGHVGSVENIVDSDGGTSCAALNPALADLTPEWCKGGRSNAGNSPLLNNLRYITTDATYIYLSSGSRILRFVQSSGAYAGWYGKISAISGMICTNGSPVALNTTPGWCTGGTVATGNGDGHFTTVGSLHFSNNFLYVSDVSNHRIQKIDLTITDQPSFVGWVGQVNTTPSGGAAGCSGLTNGTATTGWCVGGTSKISQRNTASLPITTTPAYETPAPNEGFYFGYGNNYLTSDANYIYVGDTTNYRIVRIDKVNGSFQGWIGYLARNTAASPTTPSLPSGTFTTTWVQGGATVNSTAKGFGTFYGLAVDETVSPNILYISDLYHRMIRIPLDNVSDFRWIGRTSSTPSGGQPGCSSTPVGGTAPGWCFGGGNNVVGNGNGAFYNSGGFVLRSSELLVTDINNFRLQKFNKVTGAFQGWIGTGNAYANKWRRSYNVNTIASRLGIDDYSFYDSGGGVAYNGIATNGEFFFQTDVGVHRIKKFNLDGSDMSYIGLIGTFAPTGPSDCVGFTSGMTPNWCSGGGRTTSSSGIHGYNNPYSVTADSQYAYIANYSNNRVDRVRISDGLYMGWLGKVGTTPTDGDAGCMSAGPGTMTPGWCIGGLGSIAMPYSNGGYYNPRSVFYEYDTVLATGILYVLDSANRLSKVRTSDGAVLGVIGNLSNPTGCSLNNRASTTGWCASADGISGGSTNYGTVSTSFSVTANSKYIYTIDQTYGRLMRFDKKTGLVAGFVGRLSNGTNIDIANSNFTVDGSVLNNACKPAIPTYPAMTPGWCFATNNSAGLIINTTNILDHNGFNQARGIWADDNAIYVADSLNSRVVKIDAVTGAIVGWRGYIKSTAGMTDPDCIAAGDGGLTPKWCFGGQAGPGRSLGAFDYPSGITGNAHSVYVIDGRNNRTVALPK